MIALENVSKHYQLGSVPVQALKNINLKIKRGDKIAVIGKSGSGKSTLMNIIGGLDTPNSGKVLYEDCNIVKMIDQEISSFRLNKIGFVFQDFGLLPFLSVFENIEYPLMLLNVAKKLRIHKVLKKIEEVGLSNKIHVRPTKLSGGQQQRVAIARALVTTPLIVLADEITANLDEANSNQILSLLDKMQKKYNSTLIFATHDKSVTQFADRLIELKDGKISVNRFHPTL